MPDVNDAAVAAIHDVMERHRPRRIRGIPAVEICDAGCEYEPGTCYQHFAVAIVSEFGLSNLDAKTHRA